MTGRSNRRIDVDLTTLDPIIGAEYDVGYAIIQVLDFPVGMAGVELSVDDGTFFYPITGSLKLQSPDGAEKFSRIEVRGQAQAGVLVLMCTDDPVPLLVAGLAGDPASNRWFDAWYGPHVPKPWAALIDPTGMLRPGIPYPNMLQVRFGGAGGNPLHFDYDGRPAVTTVAGGGASGVALDFCMAWVRSAAGGGYAHPSAKHQSWHLEVEITSRAAGGTNGVGSGIWLTPTDGVPVNEGYPDHVVSPNAFLGVVGNGAGGWQVAARAISGGPLTLSDDITAEWPSLLKLVRVHLILIDADPVRGGDGAVAVLLNEKLVRYYTNMTVFPLAQANGSPAFTTYRANIQGRATAGGPDLVFANIEQWTSKGQGSAQ